MPDLKKRLHMLNELSCAVVVAVGVDRMVPNHDLPLCFGPGQLALQLKQVTLPGLLPYTPCITAGHPAHQHSHHVNIAMATSTFIADMAMVINAIRVTRMMRKRCKRPTDAIVQADVPSNPCFFFQDLLQV